MTRNLLSGIELGKMGIGINMRLDEENNLILKLIDIDNYELGSYIPNNVNQFRLKLENRNKINNEIVVANMEKDLDVWHRRLGHFYQDNLKDYLKQHKIKIPKCLECKIVKMKRIPHKSELPEAKEVLDTIQSDISGPFNPSINNKRYFMTMIDVHSRKMWIFTLQSRSEAPELIVNFLKYLDKQFDDHKVKNFRTDGGNEYKSKKVNKY